MGIYWATGGVLLAYLVFVWFLAGWLNLRGADLWILRAGLAVIGLVAAGVFLWFFKRVRAAQIGENPDSGPVQGNDDLGLLVREADRRLKNSTLGRGARLVNLPLVFLAGDTGTTKTTTIVNSSLDPELLTGHVYQDNTILPTGVANIWYAGQAVFVDPAGELLSQPDRWKRLIKLVQPSRFASAFAKGPQAARAAIVCVDCESFLKPGASEATISVARRLASRLHEVSQQLGISLPVYVLFTKLDRISFFTDFVHGLSRDEASQVLGATLPVRSLATGVYAEEETKRLSKAFDELFYSLAEKRLDLLARENDATKLPAIYEFPREVRKLRNLLVQFLVDLLRPSRLNINPFLRGFYFSGVRPVIIEDVVPVAPEATSAPVFDAGATRIFSGGAARPVPSSLPARGSGSRRVPEWAFLSQFFNGVVLKDRVAQMASGFSSRVNLLRRVGLIAAASIASIFCIGFFVSFIANHSLETDARTAVQEVRGIQPNPNQAPSVSDLQKLDNLRQQLITLADYQQNGPPLHLRWGLFSGDQVYENGKKVYFDSFNQLLFADTQARLLSSLRAVPDQPSPNDSYQKTYRQLKAYLIITSNHEKSTKEFLSPVLFGVWSAGRDIDADRAGLARAQFDFYSTELATEDPYSISSDPLAIARARLYLSQFAGTDRFYLPLLDAASRKSPDVSFNDEFHDSVGTIISNHRVRGAFTRDGYAFMQNALGNPSLYVSGEEWVLGKTTASELDPATLQQKLTERYDTDFVNEWRTVLQTSSVAGYRDFSDAEKKLEKLTSPTSPLLELLWFISHNTAVSASNVSAPFVPVQAIEPPGSADQLPAQYVLPSNKDYIVALGKLQSDLNTLIESPTGATDPSLMNQILTSAGAAKVAVTQIMGDRVDQTFHNENLVRQLLEEPIDNAQALISRAPGEALNGAGRQFCSQFSQLDRFYPFSPNSAQELPIEQLNAIFAPKNALWTFHDTKLAQILPRQGSIYAASGNVKLNSAFVAFFNRAAALSEALYPSGSATPRFSYALKQLPSNVGGLVLKIGNETLSGNGQQKTFQWTGNPEYIQVGTKGGDILGSYNGPWAIFRFVSDAHSQVTGPVTTLEWIMQSNGRPIILPNGKEKSYKYQLTVNGPNPFHPSELSGLRCVSQIAR